MPDSRPATTDTSPEAILDGVTPGPWVAESRYTRKNGQMYWQVSDEYDAIVQNQSCWARGDHAANARFIAAARELVPALAAERDQLAAVLAECRLAFENVDAQVSDEGEFTERAWEQLRAALKGEAP
jgi:hypothetical protein